MLLFCTFVNYLCDMSYFDTFMGLSLIEDIFGSLKDLATSPDTAKWFWGISVTVIGILSIALLIITMLT